MSVNQTTYGTYPYNDAGDLLNTWGDDSTSGLNQAFQLFAEGIHRVVTHTVTGDFTLTTTNNASNQQRAIGHILTGTPSAAFVMTVASAQSRFLVHNKSGQTATIKTSGGTETITLATGQGVSIISDGTDCYATGPINLDDLGAPTSSVSMGSQKITALATGTATTDGVNVGQMNTAIASAGVPASTGAVLVSANDTTAQYLNGALVAGSGITLTENNDGADETLTVAVDIAGTTAETAVAAGDSILVYDTSAGANREMTQANFTANTGYSTMFIMGMM